VAACVDGELLLWGRRSKSAAGKDDGLSPTVNADDMAADADTSRHLDVCSPTQLTVDSATVKGHCRKPSNTSISSGAGADDVSAPKSAEASAAKNAGVISDHHHHHFNVRETHQRKTQ